MTTQKSTFQPGVEALEDRCVPTTAKLINGVLFIDGTPRFDVIHVGLAGAKIKVSGVHQTFRAKAVREIVIDTHGGHDKITLNARLKMPAVRIDPGAITILTGFGTATTQTSSGNATTTGFCNAATPTDSGAQSYVDQSYQDQQQLNDYLNSIQQSLDYVNQIYQDQQQLNDYLNSIWQTQSYVDQIWQDQQQLNDYLNSIWESN